jgi:hypothetical protein
MRGLTKDGSTAATGSFLDKVLIYGGGAGWRTHLGRSRAMGSIRTWCAVVAQHLRASVAAAAQDGGRLASRSSSPKLWRPPQAHRRVCCPREASSERDDGDEAELGFAVGKKLKFEAKA